MMKARLIVSDANGAIDCAPSGGPAENMAIDQALLQSVDAAEEPANLTLRLYRWKQPTLSLGYFQPYADRHGHPHSESLACVRRASGGGAIVHHHELTYCIIFRNGIATKKPGANRALYDSVHKSLATAIRQTGVQVDPFRITQLASQHRVKPAFGFDPATEPFLCFGRRTDEDLICAGYKVLGSAQRRARQTILQHGSLMIRASSFAPSLPGIADLGSRSTHASELVDPIIRCLAAEFSIQWKTEALSPQERVMSDEILRSRYAAESWTGKR